MLRSRMGMWGLSFSALTIVAAGAGCQSKVAEENRALWQQNRELQSRSTSAETELRTRPDAAQVQSLQQQIAERDAKIGELQSQLRTPTPAQAQTQTPAETNGLSGIEVTRDDKAGTVTVNLPGDVLFQSGRADLKESAKATLNKVCTAIKKDYPGKKIIVRGYTDTDPISRTKDKWQDNLDLSAARARTVAQYLVQQGVAKVGTQAFGDTMPRGGKDRSRRVEVVVATAG